MTWNWAKYWRTKGNRVAAGVGASKGQLVAEINLNIFKGKLRMAVTLLFVNAWFRIALPWAESDV